MAQNIFLRMDPPNHLVFQPLSSYFATFTGTNRIFAWWSKGVLEESIKKLDLHQITILLKKWFVIVEK